MLCLAPERGGRTELNERGYLCSPPELATEIAASSASIVLRDKLAVYLRNGVLEYLVWRTAERRFDWFLLEDEEYRAQTPDAAGLVHSRVFPGLGLPVEALLSLNAASVLAALK